VRIHPTIRVAIKINPQASSRADPISLVQTTFKISNLKTSNASSTVEVAKEFMESLVLYLTVMTKKLMVLPTKYKMDHKI